MCECVRLLLYQSVCLFVCHYLNIIIIQVYVHTCEHAFTHSCMCVCLCMYVCMCACMCAIISIEYVYMCSLMHVNISMH